ncbi:MAG: hypothetical protein R3F19_18405 [Verrucomicrobiales bacterium]
MRTQLESILNDNLPFASEEKVKEALATEGELERAVENLLWLARLDRGLDNFQSETVSIRQIHEEVLDALSGCR